MVARHNLAELTVSAPKCKLRDMGTPGVEHKRQKRKHNGLFDVPDRRHDGDNSAASGESSGVFGGPTNDSHLFGGPDRNSGLFDAPERAPGEMPGLFDPPGRGTGNDSGLVTKTRDGSSKSLGLFDKPSRGGRT